MEPIYVGVDIGGTHVEVGLIDQEGKLIDKNETSIDAKDITPQEVVKIIKESVFKMKKKLSTSKNWTLASCGVGCPGQSKGDILVAASNFPKFKDVPLVKYVSEALGGISVTLLNDADAAVSAEVWGNPEVYERYQNVAMFTLGTGIGCGLILNGDLFQGSHGNVEAGHMIVNTSSCKPCGCGQKGCVEMYASAKNMVAALEKLDKDDGNKSAGPLNGKIIFDRYSGNDYNAVKVVEEAAEHLAILCLNVCRVVDPEVIVFGGGLSKAGNVLLDLVKKYLKEKTWTVLETPVILKLSASDKGGMYGAALAGKRRYTLTANKKPTPEPSAPLLVATPAQDNSLTNFILGFVTGSLLTGGFVWYFSRGKK
jgi:glucokinase